MNRIEIEQLLPEVFRRATVPGEPLAELLEIMVQFQAPAEATIERIESYFNPRIAPEAFLPMLAAWVDLSRLVGGAATRDPGRDWQLDPGRLRELILAAAELSQWRGTRYGLKRFLEIATGRSGFSFDESGAGDDGRPRPFHLRVRAPGSARAQRRLIERILVQEKPAHLTYELVFIEEATSPEGAPPAWIAGEQASGRPDVEPTAGLSDDSRTIGTSSRN
ncbi:phage tail protein [Thiococcus pfennigii]|jgi:phage tail-like protein|uniref:phage tail protein n=1 Tax=Thiococcus pfennigii TaxID=1057 RepID=UPI001903EA8B|nr:phage tail protein [Thiococcus pfennigii]MBK1699990.1 hypothetical protein [Thiococcus pfennigii]MBK1730885.1 hypothetical protein [Thiococcus pfennigii]